MSAALALPDAGAAETLITEAEAKLNNTHHPTNLPSTNRFMAPFRLCPGAKNGMTLVAKTSVVERSDISMGR